MKQPGRGNQYYKAVPQQLTEGDKHFIKLIESGMKKAPAFREAYPDNVAVIKWHNSEVGSPDHTRAMALIIQAAKNKLQAKYMQGAIVTYQNKMEQFSNHAIDTAIDLVQNARSEKVRADLAIEGVRHKVGTPVQKVAVQEEKTVVITFADNPTPRQFVENQVDDETSP